MKILIAGYGNIGKHIYEEFKALKPDIYDPNILEHSTKQTNKYDFAFICVPTDSLPDGSCDISIVRQAVKETDAEIIVIKSTVPPGTTNEIITSTGKKIVFSPEQYGTTQHCKSDPGFVILGGDKELTARIAGLYSSVKNGYYKFYFTDAATAELSKYMLNSFLALKVTFCNEFATLAEKFCVNYPELRELFVADERVGASHTFVYPDKPFYDSHCFNKDVPALVQFSDGNMPLMTCVNEINLSRKKDHDLEITNQSKGIAETVKKSIEERHEIIPTALKIPKYDCSICLIIKDESEYLEEWLNWHIGQGVQHFYIYDHASKQPVEQFVKTLGEEIANKVTIVDWSGSHANAQPDAYMDCLARFGEENKWIGFIDADEHVRVKTGQALPEFLQGYEDYAGIFAVWVMYDAYGQKDKSNTPLRQRFPKPTLVRTWADKMGKVFVQPSLMKSVYIHNGHPKEGYRVVGEYKDFVQEAECWKYNETTDLICVDHYYTKSYEEWVEKLRRGRCHVKHGRKYNEFFEYNPDMGYCRENIDPPQEYEVSTK